MRLLTDAVNEGVREHFSEAMAAKAFAPDDIAAGRQYVKAYVEFIHYVERLYEAATTPAHGHFVETEATPAGR